MKIQKLNGVNGKSRIIYLRSSHFCDDCSSGCSNTSNSSVVVIATAVVVAILVVVLVVVTAGLVVAAAWVHRPNLLMMSALKHNTIDFHIPEAVSKIYQSSHCHFKSRATTNGASYIIGIVCLSHDAQIPRSIKFISTHIQTSKREDQLSVHPSVRE